jgi:hypothetical protein
MTPSIKVFKFVIPENLRSEEICNGHILYNILYVYNYPTKSWILEIFFNKYNYHFLFWKPITFLTEKLGFRTLSIVRNFPK